MNVPIEDALTVAHVGIVHALSHIKEWTATEDDCENWDIIELRYDLLDIQNDLERALEMTRPHCREAK